MRCRNRLVESSFTSSLAPRIANPGSIQTCNYACMLISRQSAAMSAPNSYTSAVLPITFTLSRRCHALFPRLSSSSRLRRHLRNGSRRLTRGIARSPGSAATAFSVSPSQLDAVLQYIDGQKEHHRTRTFQEEYRELLRKRGVDFEERYVWD